MPRTPTSDEDDLDTPTPPAFFAEQALLHAGAQRLARAAGDPTHPQPVPTTLAATGALTEVVDHLAATFPSSPASLPRTPTPALARAHDEGEAAEEERSLLAAATAHPAVIGQIRWLTADDFVHPLNAGLASLMSRDSVCRRFPEAVGDQRARRCRGK